MQPTSSALLARRKARLAKNLPSTPLSVLEGGSLAWDSVLGEHGDQALREHYEPLRGEPSAPSL